MKKVHGKATDEDDISSNGWQAIGGGLNHIGQVSILGSGRVWTGKEHRNIEPFLNCSRCGLKGYD
jgi:hypothetical protein